MDFKVRCIDDGGKSNTVGKTYDIIGGVMTFDDGTKSTSAVAEYPLFENVRQINRHLRSQFESVEENMRKEDLKTGMMLYTRNGKKHRAMLNTENGDFGINQLDCSYINLDCYNDDLTDKNDRKWDITKVGSALYPMSFSEYKTLWERKEPLIEVTLEEIAKLKGVSVDRIRIKE